MPPVQQAHCEDRTRQKRRLNCRAGARNHRHQHFTRSHCETTPPTTVRNTPNLIAVDSPQIGVVSDEPTRKHRSRRVLHCMVILWLPDSPCLMPALMSASATVRRTFSPPGTRSSCWPHTYSRSAHVALNRAASKAPFQGGRPWPRCAYAWPGPGQAPARGPHRIGLFTIEGVVAA